MVTKTTPRKKTAPRAKAKPAAATQGKRVAAKKLTKELTKKVAKKLTRKVADTPAKKRPGKAPIAASSRSQTAGRKQPATKKVALDETGVAAEAKREVARHPAEPGAVAERLERAITKP
ncbi:MAG: hypothetical protein JWN48_5841, partial [Myxococcaceae bacterium]|nr:hypothetical protein [Myxococcaceae bacterium]